MSNATFADAATHARLRMDPTYSTVLYAPSSAAVTYAVQPETDRRLAELELDDDWTDEDWLAMGLILMGQMYEKDEQQWT